MVIEGVSQVIALEDSFGENYKISLWFMAIVSMRKTSGFILQLLAKDLIWAYSTGRQFLMHLIYNVTCLVVS